MSRRTFRHFKEFNIMLSRQRRRFAIGASGVLIPKDDGRSSSAPRRFPRAGDRIERARRRDGENHRRALMPPQPGGSRLAQSGGACWVVHRLGDPPAASAAHAVFGDGATSKFTAAGMSFAVLSGSRSYALLPRSREEALTNRHLREGVSRVPDPRYRDIIPQLIAHRALLHLTRTASTSAGTSRARLDGSGTAVTLAAPRATAGMATPQPVGNPPHAQTMVGIATNGRARPAMQVQRRIDRR